MTPLLHPSRPRRARGFSLMELLVVIAIIIIIMGLVLGATRMMKKSATVSRTKTVLGSLKAVADEYEVSAGTRINHLNVLDLDMVKSPVDWTKAKALNARRSGTDPTTGILSVSVSNTGQRQTRLKQFSIDRFVWAALKNEVCARMLPSVGKDLYVDLDENFNAGRGFYEVRDPWKNKIVYVAYVKHAGTAGDSRYDDQTDDDFLPIRRTPYFVSAGPDGLWGDASATGMTDENNDGDDDAKDNLYSFDME